MIDQGENVVANGFGEGSRSDALDEVVADRRVAVPNHGVADKGPLLTVGADLHA
ncbi:hypothetical protein D3C72_2090060 [compost metagenome]